MNSVKLQDTKERKINAQKSFVILYTDNEPSEKELKKIPLTIASKKITRSKFNQGREGPAQWKLEDTDKGNWTDKNKWKDTPCSWVKRIVWKYAF